MPDFSLEKEILKKGYTCVAGIDEAGRGPWAGPVFAAAVVLDMKGLPDILRIGLDDSKKLSAKKREALFKIIVDNADVGVGKSCVDEIDDVNILQATFLAMGRALEHLPIIPDYSLIDGANIPSIKCHAEAIVRGDSRSLSIAAASIIAKVTRDHFMKGLSLNYPGYDWHLNMGYGTKTHKEGLERLGVTVHHRRSYKPIINMLSLSES
jgi:ribonuclease HII